MSNLQSLAGNRQPGLVGAPFGWSSGPEECAARVEGTLPVWLRGELVRTAPALFSSGSWQAGHWFDGLGILYAFSIGERLTFRQRLLESKALEDVKSGRARLTSFGTPTKRGLADRLLHPIPLITDNTNVNVIPWQGQWLALTEGPYQHIIDGSDLRSLGHYPYQDDGLPAHAVMSAHPHLDTDGNMLNVVTAIGARSTVLICKHGKNGRTRETLGRLPLLQPPYIHSFGHSPRHAVVIDHPLRLRAPTSLLFSNLGYVKHFSWRKGRSTRFWKLDYRSGNWMCHEAESLFCFHTVNQFERGGEVILDMVAYDDAQIIDALAMPQIAAQGLPSITPRLLRVTLPAEKNARARVEPLWGARFDLPSIAYRSRNGLAYTKVWGTALTPRPRGPWSSQVLKVDVETGERSSFDGDAFTFGEPIFVPRPGSEREDDGVLLTVGGHISEGRSLLLVLDAASLEPLARAHVDVSIPSGFHGSFKLS